MRYLHLTRKGQNDSYRIINSVIGELSRITKNNLLLIDDFGLEPLNHTARMAFLEILEDRHRRKSTMVRS